MKDGSHEGIALGSMADRLLGADCVAELRPTWVRARISFFSIPTNSPSAGVIGAFIKVAGAPVELLQIDRTIRTDL